MKRPDFLYSIFLLDFVFNHVEGLNAMIQGTKCDLTYVRLKTKATIEVLQKFNTLEHANHMFDSVEMFLVKYNLDTMESKGLKRRVRTPKIVIPSMGTILPRLLKTGPQETRIPTSETSIIVYMWRFYPLQSRIPKKEF